MTARSAAQMPSWPVSIDVEAYLVQMAMLTVAIKRATVSHFVDAQNFLATGRAPKPPKIGGPWGIDSLGFERADRHIGKLLHRQNGQFRSAAKTNRAGFLNPPNHQLVSKRSMNYLFHPFFMHLLNGSYVPDRTDRTMRGLTVWFSEDFALEQAMRNHVKLDHLHCQAICSEIGERLRMALPPVPRELPPRMQGQLDRLRTLDDDSPSAYPYSLATSAFLQSLPPVVRQAPDRGDGR
jgi:hypothetical protein